MKLPSARLANLRFLTAKKKATINNTTHSNHNALNPTIEAILVE